jgi:hypothetical protein
MLTRPLSAPELAGRRTVGVKGKEMEAAKTNAAAVSSPQVALDFLRLAAASVVSALMFAAVASAVVILLSGGV